MKGKRKKNEDKSKYLEGKADFVEWVGREILGKEAGEGSSEGSEENQGLGCDRIEGMGKQGMVVTENVAKR